MIRNPQFYCQKTEKPLYSRSPVTCIQVNTKIIYKVLRAYAVPKAKAFARCVRRNQGNASISLTSSLAVVAQLVRASACHAEGRGFESLRPRNKRKIARLDLAIFLYLTFIFFLKKSLIENNNHIAFNATNG